MVDELTWHEQVRAAMVDLYGAVDGAALDAVDLDDYRGMSARDAAEKIVADKTERGS